jgi:hypothetical protein
MIRTVHRLDIRAKAKIGGANPPDRLCSIMMPLVSRIERANVMALCAQPVNNGVKREARSKQSRNQGYEQNWIVRTHQIVQMMTLNPAVFHHMCMLSPFPLPRGLETRNSIERARHYV